MVVGAGIGFTETNATASVDFSGYKNGTFELVFKSSEAFACVPGEDGGSVVCRTVG